MTCTMLPVEAVPSRLSLLHSAVSGLARRDQPSETYWIDKVHVESVAEFLDPGGDLVEMNRLAATT